MSKSTFSVVDVAREFGLTATLVRQKRHLCYQLSLKNASRLFVMAKTPSDRCFVQSARKHIKKIHQELALV